MQHQLITDLEREFGDRIWEPMWKKDYATNPTDVIKLFRLFNNHMFDNKIAPMKCKIRQMTGPALAAFEFGVVKRMPVSMYIFRTEYQSFFSLMNSIAHEMIHAYDWTLGPLNKMYQFFYNVQYDGNARSKVHPGHPTQVVFDPKYNNYMTALKAGAKVYDVHASWFARQAEKFNSIGFDVQDIFDPSSAKPRLRRMTEDPDETPEDLRHMNDSNPAKMMYSLLASDDHTAFYFKNTDNWFVEVS